MHCCTRWKCIFHTILYGYGRCAGWVKIGNDCWIGAGAIILNGITIGTGAVVGAGAVVTKDVEPYTIVVGNPTHKIKEIQIDKSTMMT